jgi:ribonucleotide reductase alpha subunit
VDIPLEDPEECWERVAKALAPHDGIEHSENESFHKFYNLLKDWKFLPGGRILAGAGVPGVTLANCFVIPNPIDSRQGILDTLSEMVELMSRGGGVGINVSSLRPRYGFCAGVNGRSSGSTSWASLYSFVTGLVEQGGSRRGALMLITEVWHPDVYEFITAKKTAGRITNANLTVAITSGFMEAVKADADWNLVFPDTADPEYDQLWRGDIEDWRSRKKNITTYKTVKARDLWNTLIESAWASAEPGIWFKDLVDKDSNTSLMENGRIICTNPCQPGFATVMTPEGVVTFDDIEAGSTIWTGKEWTTVEDKWETGIKPVYQYITAAGSFGRFIGTENHRVLCGGKKVEVKDAESLTMIASWTGEAYEEKIVAREFLGEFPVYDIRVAHLDHVYWTGGVIVSNCGEQSLPAYGVCNLGHINLAKFGDIGLHSNRADLETAVQDGVDFLDAAIDASEYHLPGVKEQQMAERRIGLGTLGLAEHLINIGLVYGSDECIDYLDKLYECIARAAYEESKLRGEQLGPFPRYNAFNVPKGSFLHRLGREDSEHATKTPICMRNSTLLTQAPTGTVGTMVGTSTGIEPWFMLEWERHSRVGKFIERVKVAEEFVKNNPGKPYPETFITAMDLSPEQHVKVQAVIQKWTDSSISKTCNVPSDYTVDQVRELYELMYEMGCKGGTIYRDKSRDEQILNAVEVAQEVISDAKEESKVIHIPAQNNTKFNVRRGSTATVRSPLGTAHVTMNCHDDSTTPMEVFVTVGKAGTDVSGLAEAMGRLISLGLRYGVPLEEISGQLRNIGGGDPVGFGPNRVGSLPDAIAQAMEQLNMASNWSWNLVLPEVSKPVKEGSDPLLCPGCGNATMVAQGGCKTCSRCGYSACS